MTERDPRRPITEPRTWKRYLRVLGASSERRVDDELAFHLEMRVQEYVRRGLAPEAARAEAMKRFGDVARVRDECRTLDTEREQAMTRARVIEETVQDVRFAVRTLLKQPAFTLVAALTLALGIGANTAIFSIVNAYLFRPFPSPVADRLVVIAQTSRGSALAGSTSWPNYRDIDAQREVFEGAVAHSAQQVSLRIGSGEGQRTFSAFTSGNYFTLLALRPQVGRFFTEEDARQRVPVAVLSDGLWRGRFGADPAVVGSRVTLNGIPFTVVGVAPPGFHGTESVIHMQLFAPATTLPLLWPAQARTFERRDAGDFKVWAVRRPGVSVERARSTVEVLAKRLDRQYAELRVGLNFVLEAERRARPDIAISSMMPWIAAVFMALVGLALLIACVNVANLMLARATARQPEIAVRAALGASRARLVRQLLTESVVLSLLGLALGAVIGRWVTGLVGSIRLATDVPVRFDVSPDWRVFAFTTVVALAAGVVAGIVPALQGTRGALAATIREGGRGGGAGAQRQRLRSMLVVGQIAISLVLLICAGLFTRSVRHASAIDIGIRQDQLVMMTTDVAFQRYDTTAGRRFYRELLDGVRATPGVRSAALSRSMPLGYNNMSRDVRFDEDVATVDDNHSEIFYDVVSADYFATMGQAVVSGREFTRFDTDSSPRVTVVSEAMARRYWPGKDAVGRRVRFSKDGPAVEVVGVVRDAKHIFINEAPRPFLYVPYTQEYGSEFSVVAHTAGDERSTLGRMKALLAGMDRELPIYDVRTMHEHLAGGVSMLMVRLAAALAGAVGLLGLVQTVVGLYGVISFGVGQRTREFGIRIALGARGRDVIAGVLRQGLVLTAVGVGIGLAGAFAVTRGIASLLVGVSATDAVTFGGAALVLGALALLSTYLPARRAARMEPVEALRRE